jgi:hypothetical protein
MTGPAPTHLSAEAAELATRHQLGALHSTFAPKRMSKALFVLYLFTILHLLAMFVIPGLLFFWWLRRNPDFSRKQAAKRLHLFENGMLVHPQSGESMVAIRWDSVRLYQNITQKIINGIPSTTDYVYSAVGPGRVNATITDFYEDPTIWGPRMQEAVLRAQGQAAVDAILEGQRVNFGGISLSRAGMDTTRSGRLPWSDVQKIQVRGGRVHVTRTGESGSWCSLAVSDIANLYVFLTVAEHLSA